MSNLILPSRLLAILAHEDDEVIGCGGLLTKNHYLGGQSNVISFGGSSSIRQKEFKNACNLLGIAKSELLGYNEEELERESLSKILLVRDKIIDYRPNYIITHRYDDDYHINHQIVSKITEKAAIMAANPRNGVRVKGILYTETHSLHQIVHELVDITGFQEKIEEAINCHESQIKKNDGYYQKFIRRRNSLRGLQNGTGFAEAYQFQAVPIIANFYPSAK